jgi:uncharacterized surface protein with fasciclin (FAS1) repeats
MRGFRAGSRQPENRVLTGIGRGEHIAVIHHGDCPVGIGANNIYDFVGLLMNALRRFAIALVAMVPLTFFGANAMEKDIVDTAVSAGSFNTLVAAVKAAGLVDTLKSEGSFTEFAPTDAAFAALPAGTVENLLKPENKDQLIAVLTYHVIPGKVMSGDIAGKDIEVKTVQGSMVEIDATNGVMIDGAKVMTADIETSNGVIHVIDRVILPN